MKRNRSWTCFVFLESPNLVAIDWPAVLSVWIRMLRFLESWDSKRSDLMYKLSDTPSPIAYSSASPLESATVACVLLWEVIRAPRKYKAISEVLLLEVAQPAQSESTYVSMLKIVYFECGMISGRSVKTIGLVPAKYPSKVFIFVPWSSVGEVKPRESSFTANWMSGLMLLNQRSCLTILRYNLWSSGEFKEVLQNRSTFEVHQFLE